MTTPGAAEEQDKREADDEGRRDDRQDRQEPQTLLEGKARAGGDQREGKAEQCRAEGRHDREEKRSPGDAAAAATDDAVEAPDRWILNIADEAAGVERTIEVLERADKHAADRVEDEYADEKDQQGNRRDDEGVAAHDAALGKAKRKQQHEGRARQGPPPPPLRADHPRVGPKRLSLMGQVQPVKPTASPCSDRKMTHRPRRSRQIGAQRRHLK